MPRRPPADPAYRRLATSVAALVTAARGNSARAVNAVMTATYWGIGRHLVEHAQSGASRADYGEAVIARLSTDLTSRFGRGFSVDNLETMRLFYLAYPAPGISETVSRKSSRRELAATQAASQHPFPLSWSHYVLLVRRCQSPEARAFYLEESLRGGWSVRQLERQMESLFYERTVLSRNRAAVLAKGRKRTPGDILGPEAQIKDPFCLEFLGLKDEYSEHDLEDALIHHLETFLLELGDDFTFIGRQRRLRVGSEWYRIDLLLYHRSLRCLVLIDLKLGRLTHADAGQMNLYLNYAKRKWQKPDENPPVGLILCSHQDSAVAEYALGGLENQILARSYRTALPKERILALALERSRHELEAHPHRIRESITAYRP